MSKFIQTGALLAALVASVTGHTYVEEFEANGVPYPGFYQGELQDPGNQSPAWWTNQGWGFQPVFGDKLDHPDIIAHMDAVPSPYTAEVAAGSDVTFHWHHEGSCEAHDEEGWDCSHHGWTATYLASCEGDCSQVDKTELKFFKIHQSALIDYREGRFSNGPSREQVGYWGTDAIFYDNGNAQSVTIPSEIPSGNYVLRTEVMSIHNNGAVSERQFWPQAFNIEVTGGDDKKPVPAGKRATELYKANDVLLQWNLYQHDAGKIVDVAPGPKLAAVASIVKARRSHPKDFSA